MKYHPLRKVPLFETLQYLSKLDTYLIAIKFKPPVLFVDEVSNADIAYVLFEKLIGRWWVWLLSSDWPHWNQFYTPKNITETSLPPPEIQLIYDKEVFVYDTASG